MKTCKYGCGKMSEGGKVATIKKMKAANAKPCPPTLCPDGNGSCVNCSSVKKAGMIITGIVSGMANALGNKKRKENEEVKGIVKGLVKDSKKTKVMRDGGATKKKYAMGGNTGGYAKPQMGGDNTKNGIYGIPNAGRTDALGFKKGGSTTNRPVKPGCRGGMVKDASGNCVMERKFKTGGSTTNKKFAALAPPYNKATAADRIAGAKKNARKK